MRPRLWLILGVTGLLGLFVFGLLLVSGYGLRGKVGYPGSLGLRLSASLHLSLSLRLLAVVLYLLHGVSGVEVLASRWAKSGPAAWLLRIVGDGFLAYVAWIVAWAELS